MDKKGIVKRRKLVRYQLIFLAIGKKINANKHVQKFKNNHPKSYLFLSDRLSLKYFSGLPLTLLIVTAITNILIFNEIAESIIDSPLLLSIDNAVANYFFNVRTPAVVIPIFYFSKLCSFPFVITVTMVAMVILLYYKRAIYSLALFISLAGTGVTTYIGKTHFHRIRPGKIEYYAAESFSFPSGHSIAAVAIYGLLFYFIIRNSLKYHVYQTTFALLFILMIGFSRIYLCVHYLTDVLAGYSLGFVWLMLSVSIVEWKNVKGIS